MWRFWRKEEGDQEGRLEEACRRLEGLTRELDGLATRMTTLAAHYDTALAELGKQREELRLSQDFARGTNKTAQDLVRVAKKVQTQTPDLWAANRERVVG